MNSKVNRALLFRRRVQERKLETSTKITLPSGLDALLCRPSLEVWMMTGRIPQAFTKKVLDLFGGDGPKKPAASEILKKLDENDLVASLVFVRDFVRETLISPRITTGRPPDYDADEISPADLDEADFSYIFQWAISGSPEIPVKTRGGQTSVGALERFSGKRSRARAGAKQ